MDYTFVRLKKTTVARIREHGTFGDSYDSVINRLLDRVTNRKKTK
jgi:hypothetical protein